MTDPITPPPELVRQWLNAAIGPNYEQCIANCAAQWGADQELEACFAFVRRGPWCSEKLRAARRPKPPSLKEQALEALGYLTEDEPNYQSSFDIIRRALEALPND
jgi:hypothetical protein